MNIRNTPIDRPCYEAINSLISQDIFSYLKMLSMQYRKNRVEDNKKRMNIAKMYIPLLYVTRMTQNKNDSTNSILQHGRVVYKNCCVVFLASEFS